MNYNRLILLSLAFKRLPFIAILLLVLIPNLLITFAPNITIVFTGVFLMALLCLTTIFATTISKMNIDKDLYSIPQPGDILVCVKKFNGLNLDILKVKKSG